MTTDPSHILIIDDNLTDLMIMREILGTCNPDATVHVAHNGEDGMMFLRRAGKHANAPRPDLILLDLNMPRKNGHEVLYEIKHDPLLLRIPVVILTTSQSEDDVSRAYNGHANCYIRKPIELEEFEALMESIDEFWLEICTRPPHKTPRS